MSLAGSQPEFLIQFQYIKILLSLGERLPNVLVVYSSAFNRTFLQENRNDETHE